MTNEEYEQMICDDAKSFEDKVNEITKDFEKNLSELRLFL